MASEALTDTRTAYWQARLRTRCADCKRRSMKWSLRLGRCPNCYDWARRHGAARPPLPVPIPCNGDQDTCHCRHCTGARNNRNGSRENARPHGPPWFAWTAGMDARLRQLAGTMSAHAIAAALSEEYGVPRTHLAIRARAARVGADVSEPQLLTAANIARLFAMSGSVVTVEWLQLGLIQAEQGVRPANTPWRVRPEAVFAFIRHYPERYDWRRMPASRYRNHAELVWRQDPLLTASEASRQFKIGQVRLRRMLCTGEITGIRGSHRNGGYPRWLVHRSALVAYARKQEERA